MNEAGRPPEHPILPPGDDDSLPTAPAFRWQLFFQNSRQPLFLLDRRRRILFVNLAWEKLTGVPASQARGLICRPRGKAELDRVDLVARALAPPREVLEGRPASDRRLVPGLNAERCCWHIDFFPLQGESGLLGVLGQVRVVPYGETSSVSPLPQALLALRHLTARRYRFDLLCSTIPALRQVADQVRLASQSLVPALIIGDPGAGKKWLARCIHYHGVTAEKTFAALDCAHLPPEALATVLFNEDMMQRVDFGTIYLEEPARLPRDLQSRLCDLLASSPERVSTRLVSGSTSDLADEVRQGRLLDELRCALSTVVIRLPPLRDRQGDLPWLVERMLERVAEGEQPIKTLTKDAWELIRSYHWPGNLRELFAALTKAYTSKEGERIDASNLPVYIRRDVMVDETAGRSPDRPLPLDHMLEEAERRMILLALEHARGHKARAADLLQIQRPRLFRRMKALGLLAGDESVEEADLQLDEPGE